MSNMYVERFESFKFGYTEEDLFNLIRKEVRWHHKDRDIEIYKLRKEGLLLEDISLRYHIDESTVSVVAKKVEGAIHKYKGKLFEREFVKNLKGLKMYDKVIWDGASGKPDVIAFKDNIVHIFSLKNYAIGNKKPYQIHWKEFLPEMKEAVRRMFEDDVSLFIIVFDNVENKIYASEQYEDYLLKMKNDIDKNVKETYEFLRECREEYYKENPRLFLLDLFVDKSSTPEEFTAYLDDYLDENGMDLFCIDNEYFDENPDVKERHRKLYIEDNQKEEQLKAIREDYIGTYLKMLEISAEYKKL